MRIKDGNILFRDLGFGFVCTAWLWQGRIHLIQRKCVGNMLSSLYAPNHSMVVLEITLLVLGND
jgi:hypothetical protein